MPHEPVILQGPDDQYPTWAEVEAHYISDDLKTNGVVERESICAVDTNQQKDAELRLKETTTAGGTLSQLLLDKLNFAKDPTVASPTSTPPLSPSSSGPQSSKTSPEVKSASMVRPDQAPVPPSLKPLLNPVVWYMHENKAAAGGHFFLLTNSADTIHLARDFGVPTKNIHQLRSALGLEEPVEIKKDVKREDKVKKDIPKPSPRLESKTLFSYDDVESEEEEEEVVFKPRGKRLGAVQTTTTSRNPAPGRARGRGRDTRSPRTSFSTPAQSAGPLKPQIPIEEIDPDSFDRGSFGRGSTPLVNISTHNQTNNNNNRGSGYHGRGGNHSRGAARGIERGAARGKGRLFVP